jgi:hypothetical protein
MNIHSNDTTFINMYNNYSSLLPLSGTTTVSENLIPTQPPPYNPFISDHFLQKISTMKSESTLTYNNNNNTNNNVVSFPRKRSRNSINNYPFGEDLSQNINNQNTDIDNIISQHVISLPFFLTHLFIFVFLTNHFCFCFLCLFRWRK